MMSTERPAPPISTDRNAGEDGSNPPSPTTPENHSADGAAALNSPAPPSSNTAGVASANPNCRKPSPSPSDAAPVSGSATSRRSRRKRKPRDDFLSQKQTAQQKKVWAEHDEEELLKASVAFRSRTGAPPRQATISEFYDVVKGSISPYITLEQVGYKLKRLKSKYINRFPAELGPSATAHDHLVNKLSAEIWAAEVKPIVDDDGDVQVLTAGQIDAASDQAEDEEEENGWDEEEEEEDDGGAGEEEYPFIRNAAEKYWNGLGGHYGAFLSNAMKQINPVKGKALEGKLRKQCEEEALLLAKRLELLKEMSQLLVTASRSTKL